MFNKLTKDSNSLKIKKENFYIIGIGSSAGGLKALEEFFDHCPSNTGFAFVIIQHLSPDYKSLMPELLSRHTEMSVKEAKEGDTVTANHVYLIPGGKNIQIKDGKLELIKRPPHNQINFSIDIFFNSLAIEQKDKALAIILSGTGSDGAKGAKAIKEIGGTVFVQSPDSSGFDGMPKSVINQGLADYVLDPKEIAKEVIDFVSHPHYAIPAPLEGHLSNDESLFRILNIIKNHIGYDFHFYKKPTLLRRTAKRLNITKCKTIESYIDYLHDNPTEKLFLTQEFLIGVTKFFRDEKAFNIVKEQVIPGIVDNKNQDESIKIWVVACSSGEEAYSITILLEQYLRKVKRNNPYKVFATDLDERAIEKATKGIYNESIESEVSQEILNEYFIKKENKYQIHPSIRKNIVFSKHNILQNPPFNKMDFVSCRNMLIYMENNIQLKVLSNIHYSLNLNGYLFMGNSENLGILDKNFKEVSSKWKIYQNIQSERILNINRGNIWRVENDVHNRGKEKLKGNSLDDRVAKSINKLLMDEMNAVSICVDENYEIIHASGKLKKYVTYPEEGFSNNLLKITPDELNIPIATLVRKLIVGADDPIERKIKMVQQDELKVIRIIVSSFSVLSVGTRSFLITIIEESNRKIKEGEILDISSSMLSNSEQVLELKEALSETRETLQSTVEELETSNEEMQATNEELLASNEELQSTNEELQSLNEELHTVNAELQEKNEQLLELNSDIENLMKNINIGTIFLDRAFQIRKYTPAIGEHFQLRQEDIGRSITHFSGTMGGEDIVSYSKKVIETLTPFRKEVKNNNGDWFLMQIFPYRSQEDNIKGVVINFVDINNLRTAIDEKEKLNTFLSHLTNSNPAIIYIYDIINKVNTYSSANIWEVSGYSAEEIKELGDDLFEKIIHPDDLDKLLEHHENIKSLKNEKVLQLEYRVIHKKTKKVIWILSSDKVDSRDQYGNVKSILGISQIITQVKNMELKLKESEERFRLAITGTQSGMWEWSDLVKDQAWYSREFCKLIGYTKKDLKASYSEFVNLIHPDYIKIFRQGLDKHIKDSVPFNEEIKIKTKKNGYMWFMINAQMQYDQNSKSIKKIVGTLLDINEKKQSEFKMKQLNIELERFAYLASHDLKEPLRTVTSFTNLFKTEYEKEFDSNAHQYLDFIEKATLRMINLTDDLLIYSQLDDKSLNFQKVDVNTIINNVTDDLQTSIEQSKASITVGKLPVIVCDTIQLMQLFQNLISNSIKYRKNSPPIIEIACKTKPNEYEFSVKDNGIGIAKKHQTQVFEVFKRLHTQSQYSGTGIGLANCKRIVDNHNGKIWVNPNYSNGTMFVFTIPKIRI